jgi:ABC-2 type transport system ATP-binding protein
MTQAPPSAAAIPSAQARHGEQPVVIAQQLTKLFKDFWMRDRARAVDGISFEIRQGEIFGLLGPNGSGKSTTIKMILGLLKKTSGRLAVFGKSPHDVTIKKRIGYLPEESYLYPFLNARETLDYYAKLFQLDYKVRQRRIDELLDMVGLAGVQFRQVREYSKGMQRRIGLAQALINDPAFLILDEPTTGLDPIGTKQVKDLIITLGQRGKTILLSSHLLTDVEDVVDRMVILYGGKIRQAGTCDELLTRRTSSIIETEALDAETIQEVRAVLARHGRSITSLSAPRQKLEELFVQIVEQARRDRLATSGAEHGGKTASFLREGASQEAQGEDLIGRLVAEAEAEPMPVEVRQAPSAPAATPEGQAGERLIDDLLSDAYADDTPAALQQSGQPAADPSHAPEGQREDRSQPDTSIIDALLGDADENADGSGQGQRGGGR